MKFETDALVIKEQVIGESDKLITMLTASNGVIKAFVRNAKNIKNPKCAATSLLCFSKISVYKSKDKYIVDDAQVNEMFVRLRTDVEKLCYAQYFCELAYVLCPHEQPAGETMRILLNGIHLLANSNKNPLLVKACVEMRLLCLAGYMPDLTMCYGCGCYEHPEMLFIPSRGKLICRECFEKKPQNGAVLLGEGLTRALRHTVYADTAKLFSFSLSDEGLKILNSVTENYLLYCSEHNFKTLQFLKIIS